MCSSDLIRKTYEKTATNCNFSVIPVLIAHVSADDNDDQDDGAAHYDSPGVMPVDEAHGDPDARPIIQAMQRIYDKAAHDISPELVAQSVSLLPVPHVEVQRFLVDGVGLANVFEHSLWRFTPSEVRLYDLANKNQWTQSELREVIKLIRDPSFIARDIGPDLESRVSKKFFSYNSNTKILRKQIFH